MSQNIRHPDILDIARRDGKVTVDGLASHFNVTAQTIRRDLADLAEAGQLERVHGGAILTSGTQNIGYEARRDLNAPGKAAMAAACAEAVPDGASLFLNIGTSTEAVARALLRHRDLLVVTNNINVANILASNPDCEVVLTGGRLRRSDGGLVGALASESIGRFKFDLAVISCSAVDADGDLLDFDIEEVAVSQAILARSRRTLVVADHTKFNRHAPARIASLSQVDTLYTDRAVVAPLKAACDAWNTHIAVCPA